MYQKGYILCHSCKLFLPFREFSKINQSSNYGYSYWCKTCRRKYERVNGYHNAAIARIRNLAKQLITKPEHEKKDFVERLKKKGFKIDSIPDALALNKEDWLKRRFQTVVFLKKLANTPKQSRQFIIHKHVSIGNQIVNIPSYQVSLEEEPKIKLNLVLKIPEIKKSKIEKIKEEISEQDISWEE